ncbi:MAG: LysR family transcriptional regulator, partial [Myxococcales bacterium]|nr:LysR family transcriptional regulator [Myxococcales bacterium]
QDLVLTPPGRELVARAEELLEQAERLHRDLARQVHDPSTGLTVLVPNGVHPVATVHTFAALRARHPESRLHVRHRRDPVASLASEGDFALQWAPSVPEGPWLARRLATVRFGLFAHRIYAEVAGVPDTVDALAAHPLYMPVLPGGSTGHLPLWDGGRLAVLPALSSDDVSNWEAARQGLGLAFVPAVELPGDGWAGDDRVPVLPDVVGCELPLWLVTSQATRHRPAIQPLLRDLETLLDAWTGQDET